MTSRNNHCQTIFVRAATHLLRAYCAQHFFISSVSPPLLSSPLLFSPLLASPLLFSLFLFLLSNPMALRLATGPTLSMCSGYHQTYWIDTRLDTTKRGDILADLSNTFWILPDGLASSQAFWISPNASHRDNTPTTDACAVAQDDR